NELTKDFGGMPTVATVLGDQDVKAQLGYGENVEGYIGGVPQPPDSVLVDGMHVSVHDKSCEKSREVLRVCGYSFTFYEGELVGLEPPHLHVRHSGREAKFWLMPTILLAQQRRFKPHEIQRIARIIEQHFDILIAPWNDARSGV